MPPKLLIVNSSDKMLLCTLILFFFFSFNELVSSKLANIQNHSLQSPA